MFLDSGGFSFFSKAGDYPFTPDDYLTLVEHPYYGYQPLLWASLDYPCEPEIVRSVGLWSNADRIDATLDHLEYLTHKHTWPGLVPVVQGYTVEERVTCLEQMARRGLTSRLMAIGSLCALPSPTAIDEIVRDVAEAAREIVPHPVVWHLFGVKVSYFALQDAQGWPAVFSFDTAAWKLGATGERRNARGDEEARQRFFRYQTKLAEILSSPCQIPLVPEFVTPAQMSL